MLTRFHYEIPHHRMQRVRNPELDQLQKPKLYRSDLVKCQKITEREGVSLLHDTHVSQEKT
jgi:hypothetical protein